MSASEKGRSEVRGNLALDVGAPGEPGRAGSDPLAGARLIGEDLSGQELSGAAGEIARLFI